MGFEGISKFCEEKFLQVGNKLADHPSLLVAFVVTVVVLTIVGFIASGGAAMPLLAFNLSEAQIIICGTIACGTILASTIPMILAMIGYRVLCQRAMALQGRELQEIRSN